VLSVDVHSGEVHKKAEVKFIMVARYNAGVVQSLIATIDDGDNDDDDADGLFGHW
jgi:hypothetical protein